MKKEEFEILDFVNEKFRPIEIKTLDSKNRLTMGKKILKILNTKNKVREFKIFLGIKGDILLRPMVSIPAREVWIYENPNVLNLIRKGLKEAKQGKVKKVKDLDGFFEKL